MQKSNCNGPAPVVECWRKKRHTGGGTGSGQTTITRRILDEFGGDVSVLYHDNYYKRHDDIPFPGRK